jgi:hypothetical protein
MPGATDGRRESEQMATDNARKRMLELLHSHIDHWRRTIHMMETKAFGTHTYVNGKNVDITPGSLMEYKERLARTERVLREIDETGPRL